MLRFVNSLNSFRYSKPESADTFHVVAHCRLMGDSSRLAIAFRSRPGIVPSYHPARHTFLVRTISSTAISQSRALGEKVLHSI